MISLLGNLRQPLKSPFAISSLPNETRSSCTVVIFGGYGIVEISSFTAVLLPANFWVDFTKS